MTGPVTNSSYTFLKIVTKSNKIYKTKQHTQNQKLTHLLDFLLIGIDVSG